MKTFCVLLSFAAFGVAMSSGEKRVRRQIWGPPPDAFWPGNAPRDFDDGNDFDELPPPWTAPRPFDQPVRNPNDFPFGGNEDFFDGGRDPIRRPNGNQNNQGSNQNQNLNSRPNQNQNNQGSNQNQNQNSRPNQNQNSRPNQNQNSRPNQNQNNRPNQNQNSRPNQNQNNQGNNQNQNQNQNRRTTTQSPGPITTGPTTLHHAPQGCACPVTQQFNPVCGSDGNTYKNQGLLNCYVRCGTRVSQKRLGAC